VELFAEQGNHLHARWGGLLETGHEPTHGSKSGRCVLINPEIGRWLCRSCGERGDAATLVMALAGIGHREAAAQLTRRYGPPANGTSRQPKRPSTTWLEA
jgi:DNA primase